ncbi:MAG TPA: hypothetical protein VHE35_06030 [Kofleriaceae bacterium]|nr:hypothetical protein [Kofleriaceae bacterium]
MRTGLEEMAANNLSALTGDVSANYADYVRPKCEGTAAYMQDQLQAAGCAPAERARADAYSVAIPPGWQVIHPDGILANELVLEERVPALGHSEPSGIYLEMVPYSADADATGSDAACRDLGARVAGQRSATLDAAGATTTALGPACHNEVHDAEEQRASLQVNLGGQHILGTTCSYPLGDGAPPAACRAIVDSLTMP